MSSPRPTRREVLFPLTTGVGLATLGLGGWTVLRGMAPAEPDPPAATVVLSRLPEGEQLTIRVSGKPVFLRHRRRDEIAMAEAVPLADLRDPLARNPNLLQDASATDLNRRATPDGRFIALTAVCSGRSCVPLGQEAGDFGGWFCPCCGSHFDPSGRIRKGPAERNLAVPLMTLRDGTMLDIYSTTASSRPDLDRLIYGA